jgi:hypothetical protein
LRAAGWLSPEQPGKEEVDTRDHVHGSNGVEHLERVVRPLQLDVHDRLAGCRAQLLDERTCLFYRRKRVEISVDDESRRRTGMDAEQR